MRGNENTKIEIGRIWREPKLGNAYLVEVSITGDAYDNSTKKMQMTTGDTITLETIRRKSAG